MSRQRHNPVFYESDTDLSDHDNNVETPSNQEFIGDILDECKEENVTRLYVQNLNGIKWTPQGGSWPAICQSIAAIHADFSCFSEFNHDINAHEIAKKMQIIERQVFNQSRFVGSTSRNKVKRTYKPGGTGILVTNESTATVKSTHRDRMGRWAILALQGDNGQGITLINAYQVCQNGVTGNMTAANCQIAQLMQEEHNTTTTVNPRRAFIQDLTSVIQQHQATGNSIILVGDFNETIGTENDSDTGMNQLVTNCNLADLFNVRLGTAEQPTTYQRGHKRLDYALISPSLLPSVQAAGYDPFGYRIQSDH